ncbi:hypothetical protein [Acutalibacter muris]|uniref:hypothetical protein n=1 Tax=Acutalibacter muris TaxID=1796620 RepID=UPI00272CE3DA|nr:hypothetical protein [Acutalibacter muris]
MTEEIVDYVNYKNYGAAAIRRLHEPIIFMRRITMQKITPATGVTFVDQSNHTIYMSVGGCQVTIACLPENNTRLYDKVKDILVDAAFHMPNSSETKEATDTS